MNKKLINLLSKNGKTTISELLFKKHEKFFKIIFKNPKNVINNILQQWLHFLK